ncbi:MAG: ATP-binding protein [Opitutaceae bacterium]|nr:ATP-binding protein [Opitutaceae bacterium]
MTAVFRPATKQNTRLRCAIFGPSGSGKTFSALRIATGIGGRIALIDTERCTARKYADRFRFDVCELADRRIEGYMQALRTAHGYQVLIIDSLSHAWQELLAEVDKLASVKFRNNSFAAWSQATPKQREFIDAILNHPSHVIATIRSTTEWQMASEGGRNRPVRVGLKPEQGKGIEYEFDTLLELSPDHVAQVIKDRTGKYQDAIIDRPGEEFGRDLAAWLATDTPQVPPSSNRGGVFSAGLPQRPSPADVKPPASKPANRY